ncbi:hypothetical protein CPB85DRAFT_1454202 [Mucidula mucida]|nr:hypothetical protein CPB85DRAFT_1454202 [Mucidula mucida]
MSSTFKQPSACWSVIQNCPSSSSFRFDSEQDLIASRKRLPHLAVGTFHSDTDRRASAVPVGCPHRFHASPLKSAHRHRRSVTSHPSSLLDGQPCHRTILAYFFNWGLYGVLTVQVYLYYTAFPNDRWGSKALVYLVYVLELLQTIILTRDAYITWGINFSNIEILDEQGLTWFGVPVLTAIASGLVQSFFGWRIYKLSNSKVAAVVVWVLALVQCGAGTAQGIWASFLKTSELPEVTRPTLITWLLTAAVNDVIIAVLLTYYLSRRKSGMSETDALVARIIRLVVETGTLTAILAVVTIVLFFIPGPAYYTIIADSIGKVMFNRRITIAGARRTSDYTSSENSVSRQRISLRPATTAAGEAHRKQWNDDLPLKPVTAHLSDDFDDEGRRE